MKKQRSIRRPVAALIAAAALGLGACGGMDVTSGNEASGIQTTTDMRSFLADVRDASNAYGQKHLGHYLELDEKRLRKQGLDVPAGTKIEIETDHKGYCIQATSEGIQRNDKWSTATLTSGIDAISPKDGCAI